MPFWEFLALVSAAIWLVMLFARGGFWLAHERDDWPPSVPARWPQVMAVIPARNEAEVVGRTIAALAAQDYPGRFGIVLVDDNSTDGTADIARAAAEAGQRPVTIVNGQPLATGWTGKLWAVSQGVARAEAELETDGFLLLIDADIACAPDTLSRLVAQATARNLVLTSLMAKLRCESLAEKLTIPAFIFFFAMLYPFAWVNDPRRRTAAAAGGCMLIRAEALRRAGGIAAIRGRLIDDCAMAGIMKKVGPVWLALTDRVRSIRPYPTMGDIRHMVSRSAYTQLRHSPLLLAGTVLGMTVTYLAPPLLALFGHGAARGLGLLTWAMLTLAYVPTVRFYRLPALWAFALPGVAMLYMAFTLDSAWRHWRGKGGQWKGRVQGASTP